MWQIIRSEIDYHRKLFLGYFCFAPFLGLIAAIPLPEDLPVAFWIFMILFLMLQNRMVSYNKEARIRLHAMLPVASTTLAVARCVLANGSVLIFAFCCFLVSRIGYDDDSLRFSVLLKTCAFILIAFDIYFVLRDQTLPFFRRMGFTTRKSLITLGILLFALNVMGLLMFRHVQLTGSSIVNLKPVVYLLVKSNPFRGFDGGIKFLIWISVFGALSIFSFTHRKAYLE